MATARGLVAVNTEECKGCQLCVEACPVDVLHIADSFNTHGYNPAEYDGDGCIGCGVCYYACPEPGAITVFKKFSDAQAAWFCTTRQEASTLEVVDAVHGLGRCAACGQEVKLFQPRSLSFVE